MLSRSVGMITFTASALSASAFLIPANVVPAGNDGAGGLTIISGTFNAKQSIVQLPCSECAFTSKQQDKIENVKDGREYFGIQGGANSVVVNLTVSEDGQRLEVNGEAIYPLEFQLGGLVPQRIYVNQVASSASFADIESGKAKTTPLEVTGSGVSVMEEEVMSPEGHMLIPIKHSIFELERQPVSLDEIHIKVLRTVAGELTIADVSTEAHPMPRPGNFFGSTAEEVDGDLLFPSWPHDHHKARPGPPTGEFGRQKECKMLPARLCKIRNMLEDKMLGMKEGYFRKSGFKKGGCHDLKDNGASPQGSELLTHIKPHFLRLGHDDDSRPRHNGQPHHKRPHAHGNHHRHRFMHSFAHGFVVVLIPTMAGVVVGMAVSLVGLCVGRLIGFIWIKLYRGGHSGYQGVRLGDEADEQTADVEKQSFVVLAESEPLPIYEEAPSYEETQQERK